MNYQLGIYMNIRDFKKWFKTAVIMSIAKINVKLQIFNCIWKIRVFLRARFQQLFSVSKTADLHVKIQTLIEIWAFTLIFAI